MTNKLPPFGGLPSSGSSGLQPGAGAGGMKLGQKFKFVSAEEMPSLELERILEACEKLIEGRDCYSALVYLSRARFDDLEALITATKSADVKQRWQRLWVLSNVLARLARPKTGQEALATHFEDDLAGLHMLSKFDPANNQAARRLFERLHDELLHKILNVFIKFIDDPSRSALLAGIIAVIENDERVLRDILVTEHPDDLVERVIAMLSTVDGKEKGRGTVSSAAIMERLRDLGDQG